MGNNWGRAFPAVILSTLGGPKELCNLPQVRQVLRFAQDDKREPRLAGKRHKMLRHPFVKQAEAKLTQPSFSA